jgi:hypothetical protein
MKTRDGRLVYARFMDKECTAIRAEFKDYEQDVRSVQHYSYNPEDKIIRQILDEFPEEVLEKNYVEFNKSEATRQRYLEKFIERFDEIVNFLDSGISNTVVKETEVTLQTIKEIGNDAEKFFKLKLEIFELEEVKNSKNRKWKASMRKATTTLELLSLLYEVYSTLENAEGERLDETPLQDTATAPDTSS